jgi:methyl-accepting chemotaxis protein
MSVISNLKISTKLITGFVLIAIITGIVGYVGYHGINKVKGYQDTIAAIKLPSIANILEIMNDQKDIKTQEFGLADETVNKVADLEHFQERIDGCWKHIDDEWKSYDSLAHTELEVKLWKEFIPAFNEWKNASKKFYEKSKEKNILLEKGFAITSPEMKKIHADLYIALATTKKLFKSPESLLKKLYEENRKSSAEEDKSSDESANSTITFVLILVISSMIIAVLIGLYLSRIITKPINHLIDASNKIASGDLNVNLDSTSTDETGILLGAMNKMATNIKKLVDETHKLSDSAIKGKLDNRADSSKFEGEFAILINGFNSTLDAVISPLNVAAEYIDRISKGDMPSKITDNYNGDFNEIKNNINMLIDSINGLIQEIHHMSLEHVAGDIDVLINVGNYHGVYNTMAAGINEMVFGHISVKKQALACIEEFGNGNLDAHIDQFPGKKAFINNTIEKVRRNIKQLISDADELAKAGTEGKLNFRGDESKHSGDFKQIIKGFNNSLESVVNTINSSAGIMVADSNFIINFVSASTYKLFKSYESRIKEVFPNFDPDNIIGQSIDFYHKNPSHQRNMLSNLNTTHRTQINFGDVIFKLNVTPLISKDGTKNGFAVEWIDVTNEANFNNLLNNIIDDMTNGKLANRIDYNRLNGAYQTTAVNINEMLNVIMTPINEAIEVLKLMSEGDLTTHMTGDFKGDNAMIKDTLNNAIDSIGDILGQVIVTVEEVTRGSMQVSDASTALSQGATEQAASLEEITSSMSEIGSQTKLNAENANTANYLTLESRNAAERGNIEMSQLNQAMTEITESSKNISKIIKVIDEIAFQTNLLALNAAVEAARAGRHGKGFAVVAEEVRNLAARSASAAKETAEMIEKSIRTVDRGSILAGKTSEALELIKSGAIKASDIVGEIATSSNEQAQGIAQINQGLNQIDIVTQTNTASAEQSASAAEELSGQANQLRLMISRFKINNSESEIDMMYSQHPTINHRMMNPTPSKKLPSASFESIKSRPEDIISLDEDDYGKY